jgi:VanZ family protein
MLISRIYALVWLLSVATVSFFSLLPNTQSPLSFKRADLILHAAAYLWLSVLPFFAFRRERLALVFAMLMFPLGVMLEIGQIATPGRFFSGMDLAANTLGIILGILLFRLLRYRRDSLLLP